MSTNNKSLSALFSAANHSDCHRQTRFVYEYGMSVIFPRANTDDRNTHTEHTHWTHTHRSATDQLSCWIPNRTFPINLTLIGITDWYWGKGITTILHHTRPAKNNKSKASHKCKGFDQKAQMNLVSWKKTTLLLKLTLRSFHFWSKNQWKSGSPFKKYSSNYPPDKRLKPIHQVKPMWNNGHYNSHMHSGRLEITRPSQSRCIISQQRVR